MGHVGNQAAYLITFMGVAGGVKVNVASGELSLRAHLLLRRLQTTNKGGVGNTEAIKVIEVDFFALLYIVKKERESCILRSYFE